jgi:hypothetical protein
MIKKGEHFVTIMAAMTSFSQADGTRVLRLFGITAGLSGRWHASRSHVNLIKRHGHIQCRFTASAGPGADFFCNPTSGPTGIGNWTEENFMRALKEGKFKGLPGTRTLLPPMPWANFANISDEDVSAIFAYLKSTPPVKNVVPEPIPPSDIAAKH